VSATPTLDAMRGIAHRHKLAHWHTEDFRFHISPELWPWVLGEAMKVHAVGGTLKQMEIDGQGFSWKGLVLVPWRGRQHREADLRVNGDVIGTFVIPTAEDA
jgi:hypothetical protein